MLADQNREMFREKVKLENFSTESEKFVRNRGTNPKEGGMHHCLMGAGRPCLRRIDCW